MQEKVKETKSLEAFFDEDPTDELPILTGIDLAAEQTAEFEPEAEIEDQTGETPILSLDNVVLPSASEAREIAAALSSSAPGNRLSLQRLEAEIQALQERFIDLETDLRLRDDQIELLQAELGTRDDAVETLEQRLEQAQQASATLDEQRQSLAAEIETLQAVIAEGEVDMALAQTRQAELQAEMETVQAQAEEIRRQSEQQLAAQALEATERDNWQQSLDAHESEKAALRMQLADLETYIAGRKQHWQQLQGECDQQARSLRALEAAAVTKSAQLERKAVQTSQLDVALCEQRELSRTLQSEVSELRSESAQQQQTLIEREQELEQLSQQLGDARMSSDELQQALAERAERIELLAELGESTAAERNTKEAELAELRSRLTDSEQQIGDLRSQLERSQTQFSEAESSIQDLEGALQNSENGFGELRNELKKARSEAANLSKELKASQQQTSELSELRQTLENQLETVQMQLEEALETSQKKSELADEHAEAIETLKSELSSLSKQRDALASQLTASEADVQGLQASNSELAEESELRQEAIAGLQAELMDKLETIDTLSRDAEQLAQLEARIRSLDDRLAQAHDREAPSRQHPVTRVMVTVNSDRAVKYPLYKDTMTIGRSADSDIRIRRQYISRHHARVHQDAGATYIEDLGSKNGVRVNAAPVDRQQLRDGDLVDIGKLQFRFVDLMANQNGRHNA
jgi:chromosome segregation ATPase